MFRFLFRLVFRAVSLVLLVGIAFGVYHLYSSGQLPFLQRAVEDTAVTGSVKTAFAVHRVFSDRPIDVATDDGVVTLTGKVASALERDGAVELAANVEGVIAVEEHLQLDAALPDAPAGVPRKSLGQRVDDATLLAKIRTALHLDREVRKIDLDIHVSEGRVVVRGKVPSEELAEQIRNRVASVGGVESLEDDLRLEAQH